MPNNFRNQTKQPRAIAAPTADRIPRAITPDENGRPSFRADRMDVDGPWHWGNLESIHLQAFLQKIFDSQHLTWQELHEKGCHSVCVSELVSDAQKRLQKIGQDDLDELYSLRLTGKQRVWGIKERNIFWLLWWDPTHSICPSLKKHT